MHVITSAEIWNGFTRNLNSEDYICTFIKRCVAAASSLSFYCIVKPSGLMCKYLVCLITFNNCPHFLFHLHLSPADMGHLWGHTSCSHNRQ